MSEGIEIRNNRVYLDGKATNEYVCPVCGTRVSDIREWDILGEVEMACSECRDDADRIQELAAIQGDMNEICEWLYVRYYNDFGTVLRFSEYYGINNLSRYLLITLS